MSQHPNLQLDDLTAMQLFNAKCSPPPVRPPLVSRPELLRRLNQGLERKLTLVSAPAGYGKTTLLAEWAGMASVPVAWLALDDEDNDPGRFSAYIWSALGRLIPSEEWPDLADLRDLTPHAALQRLLVSLEASTQPLALVLDDYHLLKNPALHKALASFLDRLPHHLHLLISTRKDPPVPLARLRACGELVEVRAGHLRFSPSESRAFLEQKMGLRLAPEDLATLTERTEGWVSGLQLAALSLLEQPDPHPFIQSISGSNRFILDYLIQEVLETQSQEIQTFLLHTSLLRRLSAPLCAALLHRPLAEMSETLAYLERANLFLAPLDPSGEWFRYHHLFADLLQRRLAEVSESEQVAELHARAAAWYQESGDWAESIRHLLAGQDWPGAAQMMEAASTDFFKAGALGAYLPLLHALPAEELHRHPQLQQDMGWALALTNDLEQAGHYLDLACAARPDPSNFLGETLSAQAYVAVYQNHLDRALLLARQALDCLDSDNEWMRSVAAMVMGMAHWFTGDPNGARQAMQIAESAAARSGGQRVRKTSLAYLGRAKALEMDFSGAEELIQRAVGSSPEPQFSPGNDVPAFDLGAIYYEWNDLEAAERYLNLGFAANEASGSLLTRGAGLRTLARLRQAQTRPEEAWAAVQQAVQLAVKVGLGPAYQSLNAACCTEIALARGELERAGEWAARIEIDGPDAFQPLPRLALVRLWIARGRPETALNLLSELEAQTAGPAWRFARFRLRLVQALVEPGRAGSLLGPLLPMALHQKLVRSFIDLGPQASRLLEALRPPAEPELAGCFTELIQACEGRSPGTAQTARGPLSSLPELPPLIEPLSERELDILLALSAGSSTSEIASRLYIAESTVRSHFKNIFAKLDVHSRLQAVEQARRRGLI